MANKFKQAAERTKVAPGGAGALQSQNPAGMEPSFVSPQQSPWPAEPVLETKKEELDLASILQSRYSDAKYPRTSENKSKTFTGLIKPSLDERIKKDVDKKKIKSRNDLINFLIEEYYGLHDSQN